MACLLLIILPLLVTLIMAASATSSAPPPFTVLVYNIWNGGGGDAGAARLEGVQKIIEEETGGPAPAEAAAAAAAAGGGPVEATPLQTVVVVVLNELNGWDKSRLASWGRALGFPFSSMAKSPHGYHLGMLARGFRQDAIVVEEVDGRGSPFHHGLVWARIDGVDVMATHLSPTSAEVRLKEAEHIAERLRRRESEGRAAIVAGDLNTLSSLDRQYVEGDGVLPLLRATSRLRQKFLLPVVAAAGARGLPQPDYRPMQLLLEDAGLTDVATVADAVAGASGSDFTVPTRVNEDGMHAAKLRLDYVLARRQRAVESDTGSGGGSSSSSGGGGGGGGSAVCIAGGGDRGGASAASGHSKGSETSGDELGDDAGQVVEGRCAIFSPVLPTILAYRVRRDPIADQSSDHYPVVVQGLSLVLQG